MGTVADVDFDKQAVKVHFDKAREESKFHDPFMGLSCLNRETQFVKKGAMKKYLNERLVED